MEAQIILAIVVVAAVAAAIGGCIGGRIVFQKMSHRRDVAREQERHDQMTTQLRERLEKRLGGKLDNAIAIAKREKEEAKRHRIESRLMADHEVEDIAWIFQGDNLRDYYNGNILADTGWFARNDVVKATTRSSSEESFND